MSLKGNFGALMIRIATGGTELFCNRSDSGSVNSYNHQLITLNKHSKHKAIGTGFVVRLVMHTPSSSFHFEDQYYC